MIKNVFVIIATCFFAMVCATENSSLSSAKPNILFISIDDLYTSIGYNKDANGSFLKTIYPDDETRSKVAAKLSPNIDKLANEGLQFANAMCQSPLCGPSRTSLMTGKPTHATGYYSHEKHFRAFDAFEGVVTLPQYLKDNGYFTAGLGKIFHSPNVRNNKVEGDWPDSKYSWNKWISSGGGAGLGGAETSKYSPGSNAGLMRFGAGNESMENTRDWKNSKFTATLLQTGTATINDVYKKTDEKITLPEDQPFFLASGIFRPHLPFYAPKKYFDLFPTNEMKIDKELFETVVNDLEDLPKAGIAWTQLTRSKFHQVIKKGEEIGGEEGKLEAWKHCVQAYLACVAFADECVGEIIRGLNNSKYKDNTIIILWSDHGYFLGNKARIAKQCLWRESLNANLLIKMPNAMEYKTGISYENVLLSDIYPTVVSLCGLERPEKIMGVDLSPIIENPKNKLERNYIYATYKESNHALIGDKYKYIRYKNGDIELYNIKKDLNEFNNLAELPKYDKLIQKLDAALNNSIEEGMKLVE